MALKRDDLARDLAMVAHKLGVSRVDRVNLKKLVESLAVVDARRAPGEQLGYARVFREYTPVGYSLLFKLVEKHWPAPAPETAQPVPPPAQSSERAPLLLCWTIRVENGVDPLVLSSTVQQRLNTDCPGTRVVRTHHSAEHLELLVEQRSPTNVVHRILRSLAQCALVRSAQDMGMPLLGSPVLSEWYAHGPIETDALHRVAQARV